MMVNGIFVRRFALPLIILGVLIACAGCATSVRTHRPEAPRGAPSSGASATATQTASEQPVGHDQATTGAGTGSLAVGAPAVEAIPTSPPPAAAAPVESAGAIASVHVFSPQQAVAGRSPAAQPPAPSAPPTIHGAPDSTRAGLETPSGNERVPSPTPSDAAPPATGDLRLRVVTSSLGIAEGETVTVDVMAESGVPIVDAPLHLSFDPKILAFVDGVPGEFLTQGGSSVVFLADGLTRPGDVALAVGRIERQQGASGAGLLCRVHLRGVGSGGTNVVVGTARAWGVSGDEVPVLASGAIVAVH